MTPKLTVGYIGGERSKPLNGGGFCEVGFGRIVALRWAGGFGRFELARGFSIWIFALWGLDDRGLETFIKLNFFSFSLRPNSQNSENYFQLLILSGGKGGEVGWLHVVDLMRFWSFGSERICVGFMRRVGWGGGMCFKKKRARDDFEIPA